MGLNIGYLTAGRTSLADEVLTPRYAIEPVVKYLRRKEFKNILCPFDKADSWYVRVLSQNGFNVIFSHKDTKDFFSYTKADLEGIDCIVSNPPYSAKNAVLRHLYALEKPFMMLLPQNCLQSKERTALFIQYGLEYLGFDTRICFYAHNDLTHIKTGNSFASGYFCWNVLPEKLMFEKLVLIQEQYNGQPYTPVKKQDTDKDDWKHMRDLCG